MLSQAQRQLIIEEVADVYLGYLYDSSVKRRIIAGLVREVFNRDADQSTLDSVIISEYITDQGREYGVSPQTCYFGRASLSRTQSERPDDLSNGTKFVYTGSTIRFLE